MNQLQIFFNAIKNTPDSVMTIPTDEKHPFKTDDSPSECHAYNKNVSLEKWPSAAGLAGLLS